MNDMPAATETTEPEIGRSKLRRPLMLGGIVVALLIGAYIYFTGGRYVETDNAQLQTGKVMIVPVSDQFSIKSTMSLGDLCMASPAIGNGTIFFRTQGKLIAIGEK